MHLARTVAPEFLRAGAVRGYGQSFTVPALDREMTTHLMVDLETMGTRPGAVITSVALVRFSDEARVQVNLSIPEQQALGMEVDPATLAWWQRQPPEAWASATENAYPLNIALPYIAQWIGAATGDKGGTDYFIWCHGATFDCPLLDELFRRAGVICPWQYWQVRDTRTLYDLAGVDIRQYAVPPPHVALNDALGQTRAAVVALGILAPRTQQVAA